MYGKELIMDLYDCDVSKFNRKDIEAFLIELCDNVINMEREDLHWWDYEGEVEEYNKAPTHLKGTSVCQFIKTSNIVIHTLDELGLFYINIFSCKDFDIQKTIDFTLEWFGADLLNSTVIPRIKSDKIEILEMKGYNFLWINNFLWMWDIPQEHKAQKTIADEAYGDVLCVGYGLGLVQRYLLENKNVTSVVTVEKVGGVIDANIKTYGEIHGRIIIEDFFKYTGDSKYDCIIGDICDDIMPEYLPDYRLFKNKAVKLLKSGGKLLQWGREYFEYLLEKEVSI